MNTLTYILRREQWITSRTVYAMKVGRDVSRIFDDRRQRIDAQFRRPKVNAA